MNVFCPLASGSKGNCIYLATPSVKVLIDAGISYRQIEERLATINVNVREIDAVLVTHEHSDHIKGLDVICSKLNIPVFANTETARAIHAEIKQNVKFKIFSTGETFTFADLHVHPFSVQHDTVDPVAFTVTINDCKIGICTDLGFASTLVAMNLKDCNYLYLESNHEVELVHASSRPMLYKQRVLSRQGHLSNQDCAKLLSAVHHSNLKHVYLAHLSSDCNQPDIALNTVRNFLQEKNQSVDLSIAYQEKPSKLLIF